MSKHEESPLNLAARAVELAKTSGAQACAVEVSRGRDVSLEWRDGKVDKVSDATSRNLTLRLFVDGRYSTASTSDLRPEALKTFVPEAVRLARALVPDPYRTLPEPSLYPSGPSPELNVVDASYDSIHPSDRRRTAPIIEEAARSVRASVPITSVQTWVSDGLSEYWLVTSNGFSGSRRATHFSHGASITAREADGRRPEGFAYASARHRSALPQPESLGRDAMERVLARVGAKKLPSSKGTLLVENRVAGSLVGRLMGALSGAALQQKQSFLLGKAGAQIGSEHLTLVDDPLLPAGLGSRPFDSEGIAARALPLFEKGVLRNFYLDTYYARKLTMQPTTGRSSNLAWTPGTKSAQALIRDIKDGIWVTGFLGGNSNNTTGDFSLGIEGRRIRNGELAEAISEMNVAGNHLTFWKGLAAVGNDPFPYSPSRTPSLLFQDVSIAGA